MSGDCAAIKPQETKKEKTTMKLKIKIEIDNAALGREPERETARILAVLAGDIAARYSLNDIGDKETLMDINGNKVGEAKVTR